MMYCKNSKVLARKQKKTNFITCNWKKKKKGKMQTSIFHQNNNSLIFELSLCVG